MKGVQYTSMKAIENCSTYNEQYATVHTQNIITDLAGLQNSDTFDQRFQLSAISFVGLFLELTISILHLKI